MKQAALARKTVLPLTGAALFMIVLDNLIVVSSLPSIERDLGASLASLEWIVNAYILAFAVLMLTGAALGERFGRRRVFTLGLVVFTAASAAAGLATSPGLLIAARIVQGVGSAVVMPLTLTLLTAAFPPERRGAALGVWSAIAGLAVALGPIAGGLITTGLSWHWIFWVNVPVGVTVALLAPRVLEESRGRREPIDSVGLLLATGGLLGIVWATVRGNTVGWGAFETVGAYTGGLLLLAGFIAVERGREHPMVPLRLFSNRRFAVSSASGFLLHFAMFGAFFLVIEFLSHVRHEGPVMSGVWTLPWTAMPLVVSPFAGRLGTRVQPTALVAAGLGLVAAGAAGLALLMHPATEPVALMGPLWLIGVGVGLTLPNIVAVAMGAVAPDDLGKASGTLNTARQLGSVFGIAVPVAIFQTAGSYASASDTTAGLAVALITAAAAAAAGAALSLGLVPAARTAVRRLAAVGPAS